mgnify:CR=1 FL=1
MGYVCVPKTERCRILPVISHLLILPHFIIGFFIAALRTQPIQILLLLRQSDEQGALERGIYLNGKYTNLGVGKDILYTEAKENRIKFLVENDGCSLETIYDYNNAEHPIHL